MDLLRESKLRGRAIAFSAGLPLSLYKIGQGRIISLIHSDVVEE